jgi:hypothetical protein
MARGTRQQCHSGQWRARNLQPHLRANGKIASHRQKHATGAHIERSSELQNFFALVIAAANKNRYCKRQARPLPPFAKPFQVHGEDLSKPRLSPFLAASTGPNTAPNGYLRDGALPNSATNNPNDRDQTVDFVTIIRRLFAYVYFRESTAKDSEVQAFATLG